MGYGDGSAMGYGEGCAQGYGGGAGRISDAPPARGLAHCGGDDIL